MSDDYYGGLIPFPYRGRELYLPQLAIGRLVETPAEIAGMVDAFLARPVLRPNEALVTGYDFLKDQANLITRTLAAQGIANRTELVDDVWTSAQFSGTLFTRAFAPGLISLNSHFDHFSFYPNDPLDVYAAQITGATVYSGSLIFSVGCHSGLNVPDEQALSTEHATDWAQAFLRQRATYIGNTGFGYGDSDLVAYSERLMTYFVQELNYEGEGPQTVGRALLRAKQRYFNSLPVGALGVYDEKSLAIMTLYGLPMQGIEMPNRTSTPPGGPSVAAPPTALEAAAGPVGAQALVTSPVSLAFTYNLTTLPGLGGYYSLAGEGEPQVAGVRPIQARTTRDVGRPGTGTVAHGVVFVGGAFTDVAGFDPVISRLITDDVSADQSEPIFNSFELYPIQVGAVNRFLDLDGVSRERLVVTPAQFRTDVIVTPTVGVQRLYSALQFDVYHASETDEDFIPPTIYRVSLSNGGTQFNVLVTDDRGQIQRVVVLYRLLTSFTWSKAELTYNPATQQATAPVAGVNGPIEFFAQAVDPSGNVTLSLDHGKPYQANAVSEYRTYLPAVQR